MQTRYQYSTFAYVTGKLSYLEVIDTETDSLVDFHPYISGRQSKIMLDNAASAVAFTENKIIPGRYAFIPMTTSEGLKVIKLDTGSSVPVAEFSIEDPLVQAGDVKVAEYLIHLVPKIEYDLIVAANHIQIGGYWGGILVLDPDKMQLKYGLPIPELSLGQVINIATGRDNKIYLSTLTGPISGPQNQLLVTLEYSDLLGRWIKKCSIDNLAQISYPTMVEIANLGLDSYYNVESGEEVVCMVAPEYDFQIGKDGALACSTDTCAEFSDIKQVETDDFNPDPYPQDVAIGNIEILPGVYELAAFVVNSNSNSWTRIRDLLTPNQYVEPTKLTRGTTPVACELRRSDDLAYNNDKLYIVNINSKDDPINPDLEESDVTVIRASINEINKGITGIAYEFHPKSIAITKVISAQTFVEASRIMIEDMEDTDFTTPSKSKVLLNKLSNIEILLGTAANEQAIISNAEAFKNEVDKFVVKEEKKQELLDYSDALIKTII